MLVLFLEYYKIIFFGHLFDRSNAEYGPLKWNHKATLQVNADNQENSLSMEAQNSLTRFTPLLSDCSQTVFSAYGRTNDMKWFNLHLIYSDFTIFLKTFTLLITFPWEQDMKTN